MLKLGNLGFQTEFTCDLIGKKIASGHFRYFCIAWSWSPPSYDIDNTFSLWGLFCPVILSYKQALQESYLFLPFQYLTCQPASSYLHVYWKPTLVGFVKGFTLSVCGSVLRYKPTTFILQTSNLAQEYMGYAQIKQIVILQTSSLAHCVRSRLKNGLCATKDTTISILKWSKNQIKMIWIVGNAQLNPHNFDPKNF
jgi:hypothetical protein